MEERLVTVEFGPSRSKRFARAVAEARSGAGECSELEPDRYRVRVRSGRGLSRLHRSGPPAGAGTPLASDRGLRGDELVSVYNAKEMAWCASFQLESYSGCQFRFIYGVLPRCSVCPLFDAERAIRDVLGENPPPPNVLEITLGPELRALLQGELPPSAERSAFDLEIPDFPPEDWGEARGE